MSNIFNFILDSRFRRTDFKMAIHPEKNNNDQENLNEERTANAKFNSGIMSNQLQAINERKKVGQSKYVHQFSCHTYK